MGNNRIVVNAAGTVVQRNSFYPFGMAYGEESDVEQGKQPYKYNGKELDKMHGLNQYDSDARYYDPSMIRTPTPDPHAENYYAWSPYAWVANNPLKYIDPDGKDWFVDNKSGALIYEPKIKKVEDLPSYNDNGTAWVRLGENTMFDTKNNKISESETPMYWFTETTPSVVTEAGYVKATVADIEETKVRDTFGGGESQMGKVKSKTHHEIESKNEKTTYVKSDDLNSISNVSVKQSGNRYKTSVEMETVKYTGTRAYGSDPKNGSYYKDVRANYKLKTDVSNFINKIINGKPVKF